MNRKTQTLAAMAAALLMTGVCSCQQGTTEQENTMEPWQVQLEQSIMDDIYGDDLSLIDYRYLGQVNTPEMASQVYDEIFGRDSRMPAYRGSFTEFDMESWDEIRGHRCDNINVGFHERRVDSLLKTRPGLVEIEWSYKSRTFKTKALISSRTRRLDYDNVWSHIPVQRASSKVFREATPKAKLSRENSQYELSYHHKSTAEIGMGSNKVGAYVEFTVYGSYITGGDKRIDERTKSSTKVNYLGSNYDAIAEIKEISFSAGGGVQGHFEVSYVYGIAPKSNNMYFTYNGWTHSYSIEHEQQGGTGHTTIYPFDLRFNTSD